MRWTLPNTLTVLRLVAAPVIAVLFLYFTRPYADWFALALFIIASVTDWIDGYVARAWNQESRMGAMLDPIADKAMVAVALAVLVGFSSLSGWLVLPAVLILFREVFVSGLREYLGQSAGTLKVTKLAKWKTTAQMVAIAVLFSHGIFEHYLGMSILGMDATIIRDIFEGREEDLFGLQWKHAGMTYSAQAGVALIWVAAVLTVVTGWDYFRKALPLLKDD